MIELQCQVKVNMCLKIFKNNYQDKYTSFLFKRLKNLCMNNFIRDEADICFFLFISDKYDTKR